ncbi:MAG: YbaK/EbsC family protein [Pseudomonadota bacterium]
MDETDGAGTGALPPKSVARFVERARAAGLAPAPVLHEGSARTAEEAAARCGCALGRIVKSLVFRGAQSGAPVLALVGGDRRLNTEALVGTLGEAVERPDAAFVRSVTGYAIGGIPPLGHDQKLATFIDKSLLAHETVWAAAGAPNAVFEVDPRALRDAVSAREIDAA